MKIGDKIAKARKTQNLTQEQLADLLNVSRQAVSRWESDLAYPETENLVRLSEILQINCDYLLKDGVNENGEKVVEVKIVKEVPMRRLLNRKFIRDINTFYGEYQAGADTESRAPLTDFTFDDVEPGIVSKRGGGR